MHKFFHFHSHLVGLGIGRGIGSHRELQREWLYWFDQRGNRILTPEELLARYQEKFGELPGMG